MQTTQQDAKCPPDFASAWLHVDSGLINRWWLSPCGGSSLEGPPHPVFIEKPYQSKASNIRRLRVPTACPACTAKVSGPQARRAPASRCGGDLPGCDPPTSCASWHQGLVASTNTAAESAPVRYPRRHGALPRGAGLKVAKQGSQDSKSGNIYR